MVVEGSLRNDDSPRSSSGASNRGQADGDAHDSTERDATVAKQMDNVRLDDEADIASRHENGKDAREDLIEGASLEAGLLQPSSPADSLSTPDDLPSAQVWPTQALWMRWS